MRVVVDALATQYGGLATYVRGILFAWSAVAPEDELTVLASTPFGRVLAEGECLAQARLLCFPDHRPSRGWRLARTEISLPRLQNRADALFATLPTIPRTWRKPAVSVVYDLRHEDRPSEFPLVQRVARRYAYRRAYTRADRLLAISQRTSRDLLARYPELGGKVAVVPLGADHVERRLSTRDGSALAFGHFTNKDPALLLEAWMALFRRLGRSLPSLHILGLPSAQKGALMTRRTELRAEQHVILDSYVSSQRLDELMRTASAVILPSRYEGFGLPVLEAMRQGVPVVISPDAALGEVAGGFAARAVDWTPEDFADATVTALSMTGGDISLAQGHSDTFTWRRTVSMTRSAIASAAGIEG